MSAVSSVGGNSAGGILPDKKKAVGSFVVVIPEDGSAQTIDPPDGYDSASIINTSSVWVRARIVFSGGITGNASAADQVVLINPNGFVGVDFGNTPGNVTGKVDAIDAVTFEAVDLPSATTAAADLTAKASGAAATIVVNFATA